MLYKKHFLLTTIRLFVISILVTSSLFSILISTNGFIQFVNDDEPYYSTQEASAQEGMLDGEPAEAATKIDIASEQPPQEQQEAPPSTTLTSTECPPGMRPGTETATPVQCIPDTPPTEQKDFLFLENETVPVTIGLDELGVVAKDNVTSDQLQEFLSRFQLELIQEYPQSIFTFELPGNLSRPEIVNLSRTIASEGEQLVADAGFTVTPEGAEAPFIVTDELIAEFKPGTDYEQIASFNNDSGVEIITPDPLEENQFLLEVTEAAPVDALETANRYQESNLTVFTQPNLVTPLDFREFIPNDSLFGNQWHHQNSGLEGGTVDADVDSSVAWDVTQGANDTIIAVIDDGFDMSHPDLAPNLWVNAGEVPGNGVDDDGNSFIDDIHGFDFKMNDGNPAASTNDFHGTATAGVAAALGNNVLGVAGSCPNCSLMLIRLGTTSENQSRAIEYAWRMGAQIITNSWAYPIGTPVPPVVVHAINNATTLGRGGLGTVVLFAMNNENRSDCADTAPATAPDISSLLNVIAVSASSNQDRKVTESAWGSCMDVLAPADRGSGPNPVGGPPGSGVPYTGTLNIATTDRTGNTGFNNARPPNVPGVDPTYCTTEVANANYTLCFTGTSSAAPLTAGIAGLILTANPDLTRLQVQQLLQDTADKIEDSNGRYATNNGFSAPAIGVATHGWGRVNSFEALHIATPSTQGGLGGVDIFLRDNRLDWGNTEQPSNVLFESNRGFIGHWLSEDIKVDAPPYQPKPEKAADFESLIDETPSAVADNIVYVRVHNRGPVTDESVTVKLHWAQFGTALPALPSDFWTAFSANSSDTMQWHPLNCKDTSSSNCTIANLTYSGSSVANTTDDGAEIVAFDFPSPPVITNLSNHFSLLAMIDSRRDPISPMSNGTFVVDDITPRDNNVSYRNYMNLSTSIDRNFTEGFFVRNPTDEPIEAVLRLEAPEDWNIALDKFDFNEGFTLEPNQEVPVSINIILPELSQQGEVNIIQERMENQNSTVMGGLSYRFSAAQ